MDLRELNREEWADVPVRIRLVGGPGDGREITWDSWPQIWRFPLPVSVVDLLASADRGDLYPTGANFADRLVEYCWTDSVADDGARLYRVRNS